MSGLYFYTLSISFFAGIAVFSFFAADPIFLCVFAGAAALISLLCSIKKKSMPLVLGALIILSFCLGALRIESSKQGDHRLDSSIGKKVQLSGYICDEPADREASQGLCFQPLRETDKILLSASKYRSYRYGDRIDIKGKLESPKNFAAYDGGPEFDYVSYLAKDDIRYVMNRPNIIVTGNGAGNFLITQLIRIKSSFLRQIHRLMPGTESALIGGLLLGEKGSLPRQVSDDFKRSGLTHILVLSGSNITVVAQSLLRIFAFLPQSIGRTFGAISIIFFALMTGASATTVRATIMALIGLLSPAAGRRYDVSRALIIAAVLMVLHNPRILAFDISFQLSFLATIAVIAVSPLVKERMSRVPEIFGMREILSMTIATQIFTLPFILYTMGEISIIALIPNMLVLPIVPYAMLGGFVTGMTGFIDSALGVPLARPFAFATGLMLEYMLHVTRLFSAFPFATIKATFGPPFLFISYGLFASIIWRLEKRRQNSSP